MAALASLGLAETNDVANGDEWAGEDPLTTAAATLDASGFVVEEKHVDGFAVVVVATRVSDGARCRMKLTDDPAMFPVLRSEFEFLQRIKSDNVVRARELLPIEPSMLGIVFDAIPYEPLREFVQQKGKLSIRAFVSAAIQICDAIQATHDAKLCHYDISSHNVFVLHGGEERRVLLANFQHAEYMRAGGRLLMASSPSTNSPSVNRPVSPGRGSVFNSPRDPNAESEFPGDFDDVLAHPKSIDYVAPERTRRVKREPDYRADLYSMGAVFYEMLAGRPPFLGDAYAIIHAHIARPPDALKPLGVPEFIDRIVQKLLRKDPDERYQSARGVRADLEQFKASGYNALLSTAIAQKDVPYRLPMPSELFGRSAEQKKIGDAVSDAFSSQVPRVVLVDGPSGVGKSSLVRASVASLVARCTYAEGKYDQYGAGRPFSAIVDILAQMTGQLIAKTTRSGGTALLVTLRNAVGRNAAALCQLHPPMSALFGRLVRRTSSGISTDGAAPNHHPLAERTSSATSGGSSLSAPTLDPPSIMVHPPPASGDSPTSLAAAPSAANISNLMLRLQNAFCALLRAVASCNFPALLVLDDLQWADASSLRLLQHAVMQTECPFALVATYRSNEITPAHALHQLVSSASMSAGNRLLRLSLGALVVDDVCGLLARSTNLPPRVVSDLALVVHTKTGGNPFFISHFLSALQDDGLLFFDAQRHRWAWKLAEIKACEHTANVVDFIVERSSRALGLKEETRTLLKFAAVIGCRFTLGGVAALARVSEDDALARLQDALAEGLVQRVVSRDDRSASRTTSGITIRKQRSGRELHQTTSGGSSDGDKNEPLFGPFSVPEERKLRVTRSFAGLSRSQTVSLESAEPSNEETFELSRVFAFVHDRVQQAFYQLLSEDEKTSVHFDLAKTLLAASATPEPTELPSRSRTMPVSATRPERRPSDGGSGSAGGPLRRSDAADLRRRSTGAASSGSNSAPGSVGADENERVFAIAGHLLRSGSRADKLPDLSAAQLTAAGTLAVNAAAHEEALKYLSRAKLLLPLCTEASRDRHAYTIAMNQAACQYFLGHYLAASRGLEEARVLANGVAASVIPVMLLQVGVLTALARYVDAMSVGLDCLELLGCRIPLVVDEEAVAAEVESIDDVIVERDLVELVAESCADRGLVPQQELWRVQALDTALMELIPVAFLLGDINAYVFFAARLTALSFARGHSVASSGGIAVYGFALASILERHRLGYQVVHVAARLAETYGEALHLGRCYLHVGLASPWGDTFDSAIVALRKALAQASEAADQNYRVFSCVFLAWTSFLRGSPLGVLAAELTQNAPIVGMSGQRDMQRSMAAVMAAVHSLTGTRVECEHMPSAILSGEDDDGEGEAYGDFTPFANAATGIFRMLTALVFGRNERAYALYSRLVEENTIEQVHGMITHSEFDFIGAVALARACRAVVDRHRDPSNPAHSINFAASADPSTGGDIDANITGHAASTKQSLSRTPSVDRRLQLPPQAASEATDMLERLKSHVSRLEDYSQASRRNFFSKCMFVRAEIKRIEGRYGDALAAYGQAARLAREESFWHVAALAYEGAADLLTAGKTADLATPVLLEAVSAYAAWGATKKVDELYRRYPDLRKGKAPTAVSPSPGAGLGVPRPADSARSPSLSRSAGATPAPGGSIDLVALFRAARALSEEMEFDKLQTVLLEIIAQNCGADHAALVLVRETPTDEAHLRRLDASHSRGGSRPVSRTRGNIDEGDDGRQSLALSNRASKGDVAQDERRPASLPSRPGSRNRGNIDEGEDGRLSLALSGNRASKGDATQDERRAPSSPSRRRSSGGIDEGDEGRALSQSAGAVSTADAGEEEPVLRRMTSLPSRPSSRARDEGMTVIEDVEDSASPTTPSTPRARSPQTSRRTSPADTVAPMQTFATTSPATARNQQLRDADAPSGQGRVRSFSEAPDARQPMYSPVRVPMVPEQEALPRGSLASMPSPRDMPSIPRSRRRAGSMGANARPLVVDVGRKSSLGPLSSPRLTSNLYVAARFAEGRCVCDDEPVERNPHVSAAIIGYVAGTRDSLLIEDTRRPMVIGEDPHVARAGVACAMCVPLQRGGEFQGALYVENRQTAHAFTADRLWILELLAKQVAVSLKNAALFRSMRAARDDMVAARNFSESILRSTRDPMIVLDADLRCVSANRAFLKILRMADEDVRGRGLYELAGGQFGSNPRLKSAVENIRRTGESFKDVEIRVTTSNQNLLATGSSMGTDDLTMSLASAMFAAIGGQTSVANSVQSFDLIVAGSQVRTGGASQATMDGSLPFGARPSSAIEVTSPRDSDESDAGAADVKRVIILTMENVTHAKRALELRRTAGDLRRMIDGASVPIFGMDMVGMVVEWNERMRWLTGVRRDQAVGSPLASFLIPSDSCPNPSKFMVELVESVSDGNAPSGIEISFRSNRGAEVDLLVNVSPRMSGEGELVGVMMVGQDVSDRKHGESVLRHGVVASLSTFVPRSVAERYSRNPNLPLRSPACEHIEGAVLFADISDFTTYTEGMVRDLTDGAEKIAMFLDGVFNSLIPIISANGGDVTKFAGDAIAAVFPCTSKRNLVATTLQAIQCSITLVRAVRRIIMLRGFSCRLKVGIGTGQTTIVHIGSGGCWQQVFVGPAIGQMARSEKVARPNQVLISPEAKALLPEGACELEPVFPSAPAATPADGSSPQRTQPQPVAYVVLRLVGADLDPHPLPAPRLSPAMEAALKAYVPMQVYNYTHENKTEWLTDLRTITVVFMNIGGIDFEKGFNARRLGASDFATLSSTAGPASVPANSQRRMSLGVPFYAPRRPSFAFNAIDLDDIEASYLEGEEPVMETARKLSDAFDVIRSSVDAFEGSISKFLVDDKGLVAHLAFGLPQKTHHDDVTRAVLTCTRVVSQLEKKGFRARAGVATGPAFCGSVGSQDRKEYTHHSDIVNCAARLMVLSEWGRVLCDEATSEAAIMDNVVFDPKRELKLKGKELTLTASYVRTAREKKDGFVPYMHAALASILRPSRRRRASSQEEEARGDDAAAVERARQAQSPMVGRDTFMADISEAADLFAHTMTPMFNAIFVTGEGGNHGIGKTRLLADAYEQLSVDERIRATGTAVVHFAFSRVGNARPLEMWAGLYESLTRKRGRDAVEAARADLLSGKDARLAALVPLVSDLFSHGRANDYVAPGEAPADAQNPAQATNGGDASSSALDWEDEEAALRSGVAASMSAPARLATSVKILTKLLQRRLRSMPKGAIVFIDDADCFDESSFSVLEQLAAANVHALLVCAVRASSTPMALFERLPKSQWMETVVLPRLSREDMTIPIRERIAAHLQSKRSPFSRHNNHSRRGDGKRGGAYGRQASNSASAALEVLSSTTVYEGVPPEEASAAELGVARIVERSSGIPLVAQLLTLTFLKHFDDVRPITRDAPREEDETRPPVPQDPTMSPLLAPVESGSSTPLDASVRSLTAHEGDAAGSAHPSQRGVPAVQLLSELNLIRPHFASRIDRLTPSQQVTLKIASVIGDSFGVDLLVHLTSAFERGGIQVLDDLDNLVAMGFLVPADGAGRPALRSSASSSSLLAAPVGAHDARASPIGAANESHSAASLRSNSGSVDPFSSSGVLNASGEYHDSYMFVEAAIRETAYDMVLHQLRRKLHRDAALWHERVFGTHRMTREMLSAVAHHWQCADELRKYLEYLAIAGSVSSRELGAWLEEDERIESEIRRLEEARMMLVERMKKRQGVRRKSSDALL